MENGDEDSRRTTDNDAESSQPSTSYVYPVKSLLTGIQPAPPTQSRPSIPRRNSSQSVGLAALQDLLAHQLTGTRKKSAEGPDGVSPHSTSSRSHSMFHHYPSRATVTGPSDVSEVHPHSVSDLFLVQPIDRQSSLPIPFAEAALPPTSTRPSISTSHISLSPPGLDLHAPNTPPSDTTPSTLQSEEDKPLTPFESEPLHGPAEYLYNDSNRSSSPTHSVNSHVSHISQSGIVHLPPLPSTSASSRAGSRGSGSHTHTSSRKYFPSSNSNVSSQKMDQGQEAREERKPDGGPSRSNSNPKSIEPNTGGESEPPSDFITTRYRHETDEHGNHLVIGQEGEIRRCEDEVRVLYNPTLPNPAKFVFF